MSNNDRKVDGKLIEEEKKFVVALELMTSLKRKEIIALTKIYELGNFFEKYARRIIEKKLGESIAEIVLSILRLKKCRAEYTERINKSAKDNPKLTATLKKWILNDEPKTMDEGKHNEVYTRPEPPEEIEQEEVLSDIKVENDLEMLDATRGRTINDDLLK